MDYWHDISPGKNTPESINVVVEIPKGSQNKYEYSKDHGVFALDRVLFSPMHYPGDYGLIPQTLGEDNDPLDAIVLVTYPTFPGCLIEARPLGVLRMIDNGEGDDKLLCAPMSDPRFAKVTELSDVYEPVLEEIAHFFEVYKHLEKKEVKIDGWLDRPEAQRILAESIERYKSQHS